jgi:riboflavin biosynthesis pyrimidine reductase
MGHARDPVPAPSPSPPAVAPTGIVGPGRPFDLLFDDVAEAPGIPLPDAFREVYGGDWRLPPPAEDRPYVYVNFVTSHDGRVSFDEPGHLGGGDVSLFNAHDRWLMGLLRSRADAVLVGDNTLRLEPEHIWTAEYIFPDDATAFGALRAAEGRQRAPLCVFLSLEGELHADAAIFGRPEIAVLVATTTRGGRRARAALADRPNTRVLDLGHEAVDLAALMAALRREHGVRSLLCEGGPRVHGSMLAAGQVDEEFLTLSPVVIGNHPSGEGRPRPGLVEGVAFAPGAAPILRPISLRRAGDHLFLRSRRVVRRADE